MAKKMNWKKVLFLITEHDEEKNIKKLINLIQSCNHIQRHIIIVASGCTDNSVNIIKGLSREDSTIHLIEEKTRSSKANAINLALSTIKDLDFYTCVFLDAEIFTSCNSIETLVTSLNASRMEAMSSNVVPISSQGFYWRLALENCTIWEQTREEISPNVWTLPGYLYAVKKESLPKQIPQYAVAEDALIGLEIINSGGKIGFLKTIRDYYHQKKRTRVGWNQISNLSPKRFKSLRKIQRKVIRNRFFQVGIGHLSVGSLKRYSFY